MLIYFEALYRIFFFQKNMSFLVLTLDQYESHLEMALRLALLWRGDQETVYINPAFRCTNMDTCQLLSTKGNDSIVTKMASSFLHHSGEIETMSDLFGNMSYGFVYGGMPCHHQPMRPK